MSSESVSVIVPVYNSGSTLLELVGRVSSVLDGVGREYEIILVNDGSSDDSWERIEKLSMDTAEVIGIDLAKNYGQHNATLAGIRAAANDVVVTLDDDLQQPPEEIPLLLAELETGYDVVYGAPRRYRQGFVREFASRLSRWALRQTMPQGTARYVSGFRAFRSELASSFKMFNAPLVSVDVLLSWGTNRFGHVLVAHKHRRTGRSNYTVGKLVSHGFTMLTGFSIRPLQLASIAGFAFMLVGFGLMAFVVVQRMVGDVAVPGFAFLAATIALFSGIQLFALGTIGEYLARIYQRTIESPTYVVRHTEGDDRASSTDGPPQ